MSLDIAKKLYARMPEVCAKARKKFGRGLTLTEKILVSHADNFDQQNWERGKAMLAMWSSDALASTIWNQSRLARAPSRARCWPSSAAPSETSTTSGSPT